MKICESCGSVVEDSANVCPSCLSTDFKKLCPVCGSIYEGASCLVCQTKQREDEQTRQKSHDEQVASVKANSGLGWKTALTFFLPFVGGYFLIAPYVKRGFKIFGIVWCALIALGVAVGASPVGIKVLTCMLCLLPMVVYIIRAKKTDSADNPPVSLLVGTGVVAALSLILCVATSATTPIDGTSTEGSAASEEASTSGSASDSDSSEQASANDAEYQAGQTANFANMSITVGEPTSAVVLDEEDETWGTEEKAYILFPATVTATGEQTVSASDFGAQPKDIEGAFRDDVHLAAGDTYEATLYVSWGPAWRTTDPSLDIKAPESTIGFDNGKLKATWNVDYQQSEIATVDGNTALTTVYGTRVQIRATFYRAFNTYGSGYAEFTTSCEAGIEGVLDIEAEVPSNQIETYMALEEGQTVTIQGTVGNLTCDVEGVLIKRQLCLEDIVLVS